MSGPTYCHGMTHTKQPNAREDKGHGRDNVGILKSRDDFSPSPAKKEEGSQEKADKPENDDCDEEGHKH
jgi:hypothetical protein